MTTSVDTSYGSWPATTPPFISKYGVVSNLSTGKSSGQVTDPAGAPASLFINGEQGVWYDFSDFSTMFQDIAGTVPVTTPDQLVGKILDKSGRGNHATAPTDAKRPTLKLVGGKYSLLFNGITTALATGSIDFTSTDKMTVFAGVRKLSDAGYGVIAELNTDPSVVNGTFAVGSSTLTGDASRRTWGSTLRGNATLGSGVGVFTSPDTRVLSALYDIGQANAAQEQIVRLNGTAQTLTFGAANSGTGNFGNYPLFVGCRAGTSLPFNGHLYSLVVRGASSTAAQITSTETYVNQKTGAY